MKPFCAACVAAASFVFAVHILSAAAEQPPAAPFKPVTNDYFGHKIVDPYRYMENLKDPAVQNWIKAQADYTSAALSRIPGREKLLGRLHELNTSATARGRECHRSTRLGAPI
jgi:prolyl oligopeptidase